MHNVDVEFLGVSAPRAKLSEGYTAMGPHANIHVRAPYPLEGVRVKLVKVSDERGREAKLQGTSSSTGTGGRGATPKESLFGFGFDIPEGAEALDVTLAVTRSRQVEFLAKPALSQQDAAR
jgi:hypothetical protein